MPQRDGESAIIISADGESIVCPMDDAIKHQIGKIFLINPDLKKEMETLQVRQILCMYICLYQTYVH